MGDPIIIQKQIKDNTEDLHNFVRDLKLWEEEMKRKDRQLSKDSQEEVLPPVRKAKVQRKVAANGTNEETTATGRNKRISSYDYKLWDKFDVDKACEEVDNENETDSEDENVEEAAQQEKYKKEIALYEKELGNRHVKAGKWNEAIEAYTKAITAYPMDPIFFANRALCYLKKGKYEEVESDCTTALKLDPTYVKALMRRAVARQALGRVEDARCDLRQTLQLEPNNVQAQKDMDRLQEAIKNDKKIIMVKKEKPDTINYENTLKRSGDTYSKSSEKEKESCKPTGSVVKSEPLIDDEPPWEPCSNTVLSVSKPPHLRSQKCLKRIEIYDIDPNLPGNDCKRKSQKHEQMQPTTKRNEDDPLTIKSETAISGPNQRSILTIATASNTLRELPPPPKNSVQFHKSWNSIKDDSTLCHRFLQQIPGEVLAELFKESLESATFSNIVRTLATAFVEYGEPVGPYLRGLASVRRFSTITLFMSTADKAHLSTMFDYCLTKGECTPDEINQLRRVYEIA